MECARSWVHAGYVDRAVEMGCFVLLPRWDESRHSLHFYSEALSSSTMSSQLTRVRVRVISQSNKSAGYESEVYTVSGLPVLGFRVKGIPVIKFDVHSTFTPSTLLRYDVITIDEGEGEGDQPIKQKRRI